MQKPLFLQKVRLTGLQATILSLVVVATTLAVLLPVVVIFPDTLGLYALAGVTATAMVAATALRPQLGVYILAAVIFTNLSDVFTDLGLPSINKPLVALLIVSVAINSMFNKTQRHLRLESVEWLMIGYGVVLLASYFIATNQETTLAIVIDYTKDFIILLCVVYALKSPHEWRHAAWVIIGAVAFLSLLGTYQVVTGDYNQTFWGLATVKRDQVLTNVWQSRLNGPVYDPNFFGQLLVAVVPLAIYRVIAERHWGLKLAGLAAALLITFVNFNTYSRGSFVALVLILLFIALERRVNLIWISLVLLISFAAMPFLPEGYTERLETLSMFGSEGSASVYKESSFRGRSSEILSGWHMFLDHPLLGVGAGNYEDHYQEYARGLGLETRTTDRQAHSLYVEIAAETGTIGLMAFSSIFLALFVGMARARRLARKWLLHDYPGWPLWMMAVQMSIIAYLLAGIFLHGDFLRTLWFLVALGVSAIHITDNLTKQYTQQPALNTTASST